MAWVSVLTTITNYPSSTKKRARYRPARRPTCFSSWRRMIAIKPKLTSNSSSAKSPPLDIRANIPPAANRDSTHIKKASRAKPSRPGKMIPRVTQTFQTKKTGRQVFHRNTKILIKVISSTINLEWTNWWSTAFSAKFELTRLHRSLRVQIIAY